MVAVLWERDANIYIASGLAVLVLLFYATARTWPKTRRPLAALALALELILLAVSL